MKEENIYPLVSIEEMRKFLRNPLYQPTEDEAQFPLELLPDNDAGGLLYTDFFKNYGTNTLMSHILVEQLFDNYYNINWTRVTDTSNCFVLARIVALYCNPLTWISAPDTLPGNYFVQGKIATEKFDEKRASSPELYALISESKEQRALCFAYELPLFRADKNNIFSSVLNLHRWDLLLAKPEDIVFHPLSSDDPYYTKEGLHIFNYETLQENLQLIADNMGKKKAAEIARLLQNEWPILETLSYFQFNPENPDDLDFKHLVLEELNIFLPSWEKEDTPETSSNVPELKLENIFAYRYRSSPKFQQLLDFLESERRTASDPDWCRHALALYDANIFFKEARPQTFTEWFPMFCQLFGRQAKFRFPKDITRSPAKNDISPYLPDW